MASVAYHSSLSTVYEAFSGGCMVRIAEQLIDEISPPILSTSHVLDNACGPGTVTDEVKKRVPEAKVTAADLAPPMINHVKQKNESNTWSGVTTELLDMRELKTLADNSFTHVITSFGLQSIPEDEEGPLKAAKELYRVLQPGGVSAVAIWLERNFVDAFWAAQRRVRPNEEPTGMIGNPNWGRGSWIMKVLEDAGFGHNVMVKPMKTYQEAENVEQLTENLMLAKGMFFPGWSDEEIAKVKPFLKEEVQKLDAFEIVEGSVRINMLAAVATSWK